MLGPLFFNAIWLGTVKGNIITPKSRTILYVGIALSIPVLALVWMIPKDQIESEERDRIRHQQENHKDVEVSVETIVLGGICYQCHRGGVPVFLHPRITRAQTPMPIFVRS